MQTHTLLNDQHINGVLWDKWRIAMISPLRIRKLKNWYQFKRWYSSQTKKKFVLNSNNEDVHTQFKILAKPCKNLYKANDATLSYKNLLCNPKVGLKARFSSKLFIVYFILFVIGHLLNCSTVIISSTIIWELCLNFLPCCILNWTWSLTSTFSFSFHILDTFSTSYLFALWCWLKWKEGLTLSSLPDTVRSSFWKVTLLMLLIQPHGYTKHIYIQLAKLRSVFFEYKGQRIEKVYAHSV